jgi:reactive intermediate/imine deaminase
MKNITMLLTTISLILIASTGFAAENQSPIKYIDTDKAPQYKGAPFSQGTRVDLRKGELLFVSGQVAIHPKTGKLMEEDIGIATRQTLDNIEAILKAGGSDWKHVVRMEVFLKDIKEFEGMNTEYKKRFAGLKFPARQTVQVGMDYRVEISAIAYIPEASPEPVKLVFPTQYNFDKVPKEKLSDTVSRQYLMGKQSMLVKWEFKKGAVIPMHTHPNEQITWITKGAVKVLSQGKEFILKEGDILVFPPNVPHEFHALEDTTDIDFFTPIREDWLNNSAKYIADIKKT